MWITADIEGEMDLEWLGEECGSKREEERKKGKGEGGKGYADKEGMKEDWYWRAKRCVDIDVEHGGAGAR